MVLDFPMMAEYAIWPLDARLIYITHGHRFHMASPPPLQPGDILLHGHTHIPACTPFGQENYYLNPGSLSLPKDGSASGYMTLEGTTFTWKTLDGEACRTLTL